MAIEAKKAAPAAKAAKAAPAAKPAKEAAPKKANAAFAKPLTPSKELAAVIGAEPIARTGVVSKLWEYIKKHDLQDPKNKRDINADAKLKAVFGKEKVTMFEMNKLITPHLK